MGPVASSLRSLPWSFSFYLFLEFLQEKSLFQGRGQPRDILGLCQFLLIDLMFFFVDLIGQLQQVHSHALGICHWSTEQEFCIKQLNTELLHGRPL